MRTSHKPELEKTLTRWINNIGENLCIASTKKVQPLLCPSPKTQKSSKDSSMQSSNITLIFIKENPKNRVLSFQKLVVVNLSRTICEGSKMSNSSSSEILK